MNSLHLALYCHSLQHSFAFLVLPLLFSRKFLRYLHEVSYTVGVCFPFHFFLIYYLCSFGFLHLFNMFRRYLYKYKTVHDCIIILSMNILPVLGFVCMCLWQVLLCSPRLALNSPSSGDPPASVSEVLGLQTCTTMPGCLPVYSFYYVWTCILSPAFATITVLQQTSLYMNMWK
jgi:hypothetical protein